MKRLEDIEKLSDEELLAIAGDPSVQMPSELQKELAALVGAAELAGPAVSEKKTGRLLPRAAAALAIAAAIAAVMVLAPASKTPKDTFDDPVLAYQEVEKNLNYIACKFDKARDIAGSAVPVIEKTEEMVANITRKK